MYCFVKQFHQSEYLVCIHVSRNLKMQIYYMYYTCYITCYVLLLSILREMRKIPNQDVIWDGRAGLKYIMETLAGTQTNLMLPIITWKINKLSFFYISKQTKNKINTHSRSTPQVKNVVKFQLQVWKCITVK